MTAMFRRVPVPLCLLLLLAPGARPFCRGCYGNPDEKRLLDFLFSKVGYNPLVRPAYHERDNVTVHFGMDIEEILEMDENSGRITSRGILRLWWQDFQLMWEPEEYGGLKQMAIPPKLIWTPDVTLYNGINVDMNKDTMLTVYYNGDIVWMAPVVMESTCNHEFRSDSWHCPYNFRSWTLSSRYLDLKPYEGRADIEMDDKHVGQRWVVLDHHGERRLDLFSCCRDPFVTMNYMLKLRIKIGHPSIMGKRSIRDIRDIRDIVKRLPHKW